MRYLRIRHHPLLVSTLAVEWIEIYQDGYGILHRNVSTLAVEWIEMTHQLGEKGRKMSPPSRWSGLK